MAVRKRSPSLNISSKLAVEVFTLGLCTRYSPSEIAACHTAATARLAVTVAELRKFSRLFTNQEFDGHYDACSDLTQHVIDHMEEEARQKGYVVTTKKLNAMIATAQHYGNRCSLEAKLVKELSSRRATEEMEKKFIPPAVSDDDLAYRVRRIDELAAALNTANPLAAADLDLVDPKIRPLVERLQTIFQHKNEYKRLLYLACQTPAKAQRLLNMFQRLLDVLKLPGSSFEQNLIAATQRLVEKSNLYPECYNLEDVVVPKGNIMKSSTVGRGGSADIQLATYKGQTVCLKVIRLATESQQEHVLKKSSNEAVIWGQLSHPNLLPFFGVFCATMGVGFVAPWMENGHIVAYLEKHPAANRVLLTLDVAEGLLFLHRKRIIHGDLKGYNILVKESGRACLADFGMSSVSDEDIAFWTTNPSPLSEGGTLRWQAPELLKLKEPGDKPIRNTQESDIYAWSSVVYQIFTDELPYPHITKSNTLIKRVLKGERPKRPSASSRIWTEWGLTESIWSLMEDCWVGNPDKRPTAMKVMQRLKAMSLPVDKRPVERDDFSPTAFRESIRADLLQQDELTVEVFERLVQPSTPHDSGI